MNGPQFYPDEIAGPFPRPPLSFTDAAGRAISVCVHGNGPVEDRDAEFEALVSMYATFDPADRAQGIPPSGEDRVRRWLETLFDDVSVNVIAWHDDRAVGHATLVADNEGGYELAIFVHQEYQHAGIGSRLLRGLLGEAVRRDIDRVWLTVEHWNDVAIRLYHDVGFETTDTESFERVMALRLSDGE